MTDWLPWGWNRGSRGWDSWQKFLDFHPRHRHRDVFHIPSKWLLPSHSHVLLVTGGKLSNKTAKTQWREGFERALPACHLPTISLWLEVAGRLGGGWQPQRLCPIGVPILKASGQWMHKFALWNPLILQDRATVLAGCHLIVYQYMQSYWEQNHMES